MYHCAMLACLLVMFVPVSSATFSEAGHSSYPHNLVHDLKLTNSDLTTENYWLKQQNAKLDDLQACLAARSHHKTLVESSASWTIRDLNTNVANLTQTLHSADRINNLLHDENYNLTQANDALVLLNRQHIDSNVELAAELQAAHSNEWSLTAQVDALTQQNQDLQQQKFALDRRSSNLESYTKGQAATIEALRSENKLLEDKNYFLEQTSNEYEQVNSDLTVNNNQLSDTNRALDNTNQRLETLTTLLESQVPWLSAKNLELNEQNAATISESDFVERRNNAYETTVQNLRYEVQQLNAWVLRLERATREEPISQHYATAFESVSMFP